MGDIHGAFSALERDLQRIAFDPERDRLFAVGDLVDRGPESALVLQWLDQPWFYAICGNHDYMTWRAALGNPFPDVDYERYGAWLYALPRARQHDIGERLAALPIGMEVATPSGPVGLLHADCPCDDWRDIHRIDWQELSDMYSMAGSCLWSRARIRRQYTGTIRNIRAVVHGHTPVSAMEKLGNVYFIETAGWATGGHFTLLDLHSLKPLVASPSAKSR